ncbi:Putative sulfatase, alkaline-phosphatase-like, core domain superfamily [Colletotrichum destructivum]|uniref:Sulfatase, alkaline-phosphatase-like, core domain superfamily n=1 Tax=Colletotrichum destructivum TaxID=34406 RepID=A0AAX4HWY2_9PEZI|nr:Putative sulfatase, alkaline-phosphatase-like, core domain superfamily [Colletotrichum destructivum]
MAPSSQIPPPYEKPPKPNGLAVDKPNFIIFMPDQLRYDSLGCNGNKTVKTPNIDGFAAEGTRFTNCFVQASVCAQSRCSMFTGNYPHVSGHRSLENLIKPWEPNLFRSLRERGGYHVACLAPRGDTFAPAVTELSLDEYGFLETPEFVPRFASGGAGAEPEDKEDIWRRLFYKGLRNPSEAMDYDDAVVKGALKWLEHPPADKPWVLFMPLIFPHCPFQVEEPYFSMYDRSQMSKPTNPADKTGYEPRYMQLNRERYGTHRATPEIWAEVMATYYGMISRLDDQFGRVVERTKALGHWDSTVTLFFTDHGEYLGDHGMIEKWPSGVSDSLTHEPLLVGGAGLPRGVVYDEMCEMVDLVPTVLQLAGVGEHFPHCGASLASVLASAGRDGRTGLPLRHKEFAFTEGGFLASEEPLLEQAPYPYDIKAALQHEDTTVAGKAVACRDRRWTFVYRLYEPAELYDRAGDPGELHNLAEVGEYADVRRRMEGVVLRWMVASSDFLPWQKDPRFPAVEMESVAEQFRKRGGVLEGDGVKG